MPYFVHLKDRPLPTDLHYLAFASRHAFASRANAFARVKAIGGQSTHTISFVASDSELSEWRSRERARLRSGEYMHVPWKHEEPYEYHEHYAHLSIDKPGMIAYTPDYEHGVSDKQIRLTPGRYLERFYADRLTREEIAAYVAQVSAVKTEFSIATSREDIRKVYCNGPSSCMGGPKSHTNQYWREEHLDGHHPAEVYGAPSDLAVAYYGTIDEPSQRSVIWPAKKRYVRIYGTGPLEQLLTRAGYTHGSIQGAKILKIELSNGGYLIPYVDGISYASVYSNEFLRLDNDGPINCSTTAGSHGGETCDEDDDRDRCRHCGDYTDYDDLTDDLCPGCLDDRWNCAGCDDEYFGDDSATPIGDEWYCPSCTRERTSTCEDENCSNTWIEENEFSDAETETRVAHDLRDLCPNCVARYVWCDVCEKAHDSEDGICPYCGRSPRCEHTGDLVGLIDRLTDDRIGGDENETACDCTYCNPIRDHHYTLYDDRSVLWSVDGEEIAFIASDSLRTALEVFLSGATETETRETMYRLETFSSVSETWQTCYFSDPTTYQQMPAIGTFDRVVARRDYLATNHPNAQYRIVREDAPSMPFPHGFTMDQIARIAHVDATV